MADYRIPTVVEPVISLEAMTPLEHLVLGLVFDAEDDRDGTYLHSWCGPSDVVTVRFEALRQALQASCGEIRSVIGAHVGTLIAGLDAQAEAEVEPDDYIDLDLSHPEIGWDRVLQVSCGGRRPSTRSSSGPPSPATPCASTASVAP